METKRGRMLLTFIAMVYFLLQWGVGHTIMRSTIWSHDRIPLQEDHRETVMMLRSMVSQRCDAGQANRVVFDDADVLLPALISTLEAEGRNSCSFARSTPVTPWNTSAAVCRTLAVREYSPIQAKFGLEMDRMLQPTFPGHWKEIARWVSPQRDYAFALFSPEGCTQENDGARR